MPSKLRFYARAGMLVTVPGAPRQNHAPLGYVGRALDPVTRELRASATPYEVKADTDAARRLVKLVVRDRSLWPADEATAAACGVPFIPCEMHDGEWHPVIASAQRAKPKGSDATK